MKPYLSLRREKGEWVFEYGDSNGGPWLGTGKAFTIALHDGDRMFEIGVHEPAALEASRAKQREEAGLDES